MNKKTVIAIVKFIGLGVVLLSVLALIWIVLAPNLGAKKPVFAFLFTATAVLGCGLIIVSKFMASVCALEDKFGEIEKRLQEDKKSFDAMSKKIDSAAETVQKLDGMIGDPEEGGKSEFKLAHIYYDRDPATGRPKGEK